MLRRILAGLLVTLSAFGAVDVTPAQACPMCKAANDSEEDRPRAYMYSILFMLSMPVVLFTGFGVGFYRLAKKRDLMIGEGQLPADDAVQDEG